MIQIQSERVIGAPWYYLGRSIIAWTENDFGEQSYGRLRWTRRGAERSLIRSLGVAQR
jgi:hypothetical protein